MKGGVENETSSPFLPSSQTLVKPVGFLPDLYSFNYVCFYSVHGKLCKIGDCNFCAYHGTNECFYETKKK